jgi:hypothetical protein
VEVKSEMKSAYEDDDVIGSLTAALVALLLETNAALAAVAEETAAVKLKGAQP